MSRKTRKLMWSVPLIAAVAVIGALVIFVAQTPNGTQAHDLDLPGIVTGVMAEADGRDTIDLTWKAPASGGAPDYYRIDRSDDGDNWMRLVQMHTDGLSYTDMMGLKPNKTYHYRVFAMNSAGTGPSSDLSAHSMTTTDDAVRPGVVRMLTATVDGPNQINLSWYPPEDNGGSSITRYCISTAKDTADDTADAGTLLPTAASTAVTLGGATLPCAHNTDPGAYSVPAGTPDTRAGHLAAIAGGDSSGVIVVRAPQDGSMKVSYMHKKLPSETSRRYEVYAVNSKGTSTAASAVSPIPQTDAADKPAAPTLRLVPTGSGTGTTADPFIPDGGANLYWTWPDNGGKDIISWQLQQKVDGGEWTDLGSATTPATQATENDIASPGSRAIAGAEYVVAAGELSPDAVTGAGSPNSQTTRFQVRAYNGSSGAWSNAAIITIRSTWNATTSAAVASTSFTTAVGTVEPTLAKYLRQIDLSWTDRPSTSYLIDYAEVDGDNATDDVDREWMALQTDTGYSKSTYNHKKGLEPGVQRHYRVTSLKSGVYGAIFVAVGSTKAATGPAEVRGLRTSSDDPTKIKLEWTKPTADGGQPITGYRVEIGSDASWPTANADVAHMSESCPTLSAEIVCVREIEGADTTMFTLGKLDAGTDRWFRVFAINKVFAGDTDAPTADDKRTAVTVKGTSIKSGTPGMPLDLTVQPARDANEDDPANLGIDILWNAPGNPAGDSVTAYVIARRTKASSDAAWSNWDEDWASISGAGNDFLRTHITDTDEPDNLANGEMREYRVKAKSGAGSGPSTDVVTYPVAEGAHAHVMASGTITAKTVTVGMTATVDATMYFTEATGYSVMSSMPSYAMAEVDDMGMVTITGVAAGDSTITITATGKYGPSVTQTFMVTVRAANTDPMANDMTIDPVTVTVGMSSDAMDVSDYFSDADGDDLTYSAQSSDATIADATVSGNMLTITGVAEGRATIKVYASDGMGGTDAMRTIMVTVNPVPLVAPMIKGTNPVGSGIVLVSWDVVPNATGYTLIATNLSDPSGPTRTAPADADDVSGQIQNLTVGDVYLVFVGAFNDDLEFELSDYVRFTAE